MGEAELHPMRRSTDVIENELKNINRRLELMQDDFVALRPALEKIALMEERHTQSEGAVKRAFVEMEKLEDKVDTNKKSDDIAHMRYNVYIAFVYGIVFCAGTLGGFVGKDIVDAVRDSIKRTEHLDFRVEALEKKIKP